MLQEVLTGLKAPQKNLPSKYFYDKRGSELFEQITQLEEYYPTRTERHILESHVSEIAACLGSSVELIEPGSGSSDKTRILLKNLPNIHGYIPMDISGDYLNQVAGRLQADFPRIKIIPLHADYSHSFTLPETVPGARKVIFFPGSTIGNFKKKDVNLFMEKVKYMAGTDGACLIGADLKKNTAVLERAYNDSKGITALFNKNILLHLNNKLGSCFNPDLFTHKAIWNEEYSRIEMHLFADKDFSVMVGGQRIDFRKGESIHTENSHKYTLDGFAEMVAPWFEVKKVWTDERGYFSLQYMEPV